MLRLLLIPSLFVLGGWSTLLFTPTQHSILTFLWHRHLEVPPGQKLIGSIDAVSVSNDLVKGKGSKLVLDGWAVFVQPPSHVKQLEIRIDQETMACVTDFFSRPDVARAYARPDFELSGWRTAIRLDGIPAGEHTLTVRATADNGVTADLPPRAFNIQ